MDKEERIDRIVGLIYETANNAQGPDTVIDAISAELGTASVPAAAYDSQLHFIRAYVGRVFRLGQSPGMGDPGSQHGEREDPATIGEPFDWHADARQLLRRLAPHMERSASMRQRMHKLEEQQAIRQMELAHLPFGLAWIGPDLHVISVNVRGDEMLKAADGLGLRDARLYTWLATDLERLELALHAAMRPVERKSRLLAIRRRGQTLPLLASIIPAVTPPHGTPAAIGPMALVVLQNPDETRFGLKHLQMVYGFTTAERALAEALLRNETVESFAESAGVSRNTVRSHLARLFTKTGTARQAELVRLLMLARPAV